MIINPTILEGTINIPSSKSEAHRAVICASLAKGGVSTITYVTMSKDIIATVNALVSLGADIKVVPSSNDYSTLQIGEMTKLETNVLIDCNESGSTLRFLIPLALSLYNNAAFTGSGRLVDRPLQVYFNMFNEFNIEYSHGDNFLPLNIRGSLKPHNYYLAGDISSQFISGIMLAMGLFDEPSSINITTSLHSKPYIDITQDIMAKFSANTNYNLSENKYTISGGGYKATDFCVMGDWSQVGYFLLAGTRSKIKINGLSKTSKQGDKVILDILNSMGANIYWQGDALVSDKATLKSSTVDVSQCPDLAPVVAAAMAIAKGKSKIIGGQRLRLKESDRIDSIVTTINSLGGNAQALDDGMIIQGVDTLQGAKVLCYNDHRIAMMIGALSVYCKGEINIIGHECVDKSYPNFWQDFINMGGEYE